MTDPRSGEGDLGPDESSGPSSFRSRGLRRPIAFPGRSPSAPVRPLPRPPSDRTATPPGQPAAAEALPSGPRAAAESPSRLVPDGVAPPAAVSGVAAELFGDRLSLAVDYARLLATDGVIRGLIGPREVPRLWERHLVNCAVMTNIIPFGASVVDVGSGAGLPGIVLAVARPDLSIILVEPLARRTAFLEEAVSALGLSSTVMVVRGRAEDVVDGPPAGADIVTARAVAPLDRLAGWCLPLVRTGGRLLALKGASAADEIAEHRAAIAELGGADPVLRLCGQGQVDPLTTVVEIVKLRDVVQPRPTPSSRMAGPKHNAGGKAGGRGSGQRRTRRG